LPLAERQYLRTTKMTASPIKASPAIRSKVTWIPPRSVTNQTAPTGPYDLTYHTCPEKTGGAMPLTQSTIGPGDEEPVDGALPGERWKSYDRSTSYSRH
jgi:hypothetical protein